MKNEHFDSGVMLAEILHDVRPGEGIKEAAATEALLESPQAHRALCKIAADLYEVCGKGQTAAGILYTKLASEDLPVESFVDFTEPVIEALGELEMTKDAAAKAFLPRMVGGAAGLVPSSLSTVAALSVLLGAGVGGGAWMLNRDSTEDNAELESMQRRVQQYDKATAQLTNKLKRRGQLPKDKEEGKEA